MIDLRISLILNFVVEATKGTRYEKEKKKPQIWYPMIAFHPFYAFFPRMLAS